MFAVFPRILQYNSKFLGVLIPFYDFADFFGNIWLEPNSVL